MGSAFYQVLIFGTLAAAGNILGGLVLFPKRFRPNAVLKYLLAIGAGFMLSVTVIEILPKTVALWSRPSQDGDELFIPMALLLAGYVLTQFVEHTLAPHFHLGEEMHCAEDHHDHAIVSAKSAYTAVGGLVVHTFFDGVSIAAAAQINAKVGFLVFVAVLLHKLPEGFTIGSMVLAAGKGRRQVMFTTGLLGLTTLAGALIFHAVGTRVDGLTAYALPVAGGVTLYIAASDLIPEVNHHGGSPVKVSLAIFAGIGLFFAAHLILHHLVG